MYAFSYGPALRSYLRNSHAYCGGDGSDQSSLAKGSATHRALESIDILSEIMGQAFSLTDDPKIEASDHETSDNEDSNSEDFNSEDSDDEDFSIEEFDFADSDDKDSDYKDSDNKDSDKPHRVLLASLALVSKTFNGPATKALWSQLDSFSPLLRLFASLEGYAPNAEGEIWVATDVSHYAT